MVTKKQTVRPFFTWFSPRLSRLEFSQSNQESDELIAAIDDDIELHDDDWKLNEHQNTEELMQYWDEVEDDLENDPKWIKFSDESD